MLALRFDGSWLKVMRDESGNPEEERRADFYNRPWAKEAVCRYFYRKVGLGFDNVLVGVWCTVLCFCPMEFAFLFLFIFFFKGRTRLASSNLTFLLIAIDRNGFRRTKDEGQIYKTLLRSFNFCLGTWLWSFKVEWWFYPVFSTLKDHN